MHGLQYQPLESVRIVVLPIRLNSMQVVFSISRTTRSNVLRNFKSTKFQNKSHWHTTESIIATFKRMNRNDLIEESRSKIQDITIILAELCIEIINNVLQPWRYAFLWTKMYVPQEHRLSEKAVRVRSSPPLMNFPATA
eukprot:TRINITY_DN82_c1_g3_i1.p1 TRINITY_DN82_c1_g3~~TRINITY_DN82_c1_g3_i1.p1  ORF type:complete len:139 (-),score=8.48 TRINITY_DN82_c1_g3_i1:429-845(-)